MSSFILINSSYNLKIGEVERVSPTLFCYKRFSIKYLKVCYQIKEKGFSNNNFANNAIFMRF